MKNTLYTYLFILLNFACCNLEDLQTQNLSLVTNGEKCEIKKNKNPEKTVRQNELIKLKEDLKKLNLDFNKKRQEYIKKINYIQFKIRATKNLCLYSDNRNCCIKNLVKCKRKYNKCNTLCWVKTNLCFYKMIYPCCTKNVQKNIEKCRQSYNHLEYPTEFNRVERQSLSCQIYTNFIIAYPLVLIAGVSYIYKLFYPAGFFGLLLLKNLNFLMCNICCPDPNPMETNLSYFSAELLEDESDDDEMIHEIKEI